MARAFFFGEPDSGVFKNCFTEERVMLNKKLVLGSLAGATLLLGAIVMAPTTAEAVGLMKGVCVNCHTMHSSQGGVTNTPLAQLLAYNGCVGCHAIAGADNDTGTGKPTAAPNAPQVDAPALLADMLSGGYFSAVSADGDNNHTVGAATGGAATALANAPGSGTTFAAGANGVDFDCTDCHGEAQGGHHSYTAAGSFKAGTASTNSYRMLRADKNNDGTSDGVRVTSGSVPSAVWGVNDGYANTMYLAVDMNAFCADCHTDFHTLANTQSGGEWIRHPTDVNSMTYGVGFTSDATVPVGETDNHVMCISCHRAHGSDDADLLRFSYSDNVAGAGGASIGCESCHGAK
jgi:hypothetical protein